MNKISVIIPMYNAEPFIRQCIRSVTDQTYRNLEILVIDDGSVDKGPAICRELAEADGRIMLLRQENQGVSAARNTGIDRACGEYVFFLDSDDAIHPRLLDEMVGRAEGDGAELTFCGYAKLEGGALDEALARAWEEAQKAREQGGGDSDAAPQGAGDRAAAGKPLTRAEGDQTRWQTVDEEKTESWFHVKHTDIFSGIGGKLILRSAIGDIRFDRSLANGEDTWFLYQLIDRQVKSAFCENAWYYYRAHAESVTNSAGTAKGRRYFECSMRIRDGEYRKGRTDYAMRWEIVLAEQLKRSYESLRQWGEREAAADLRRMAASQMEHPLFRDICLSDRMLFRCCFCCYPVYVILNKLVRILAKGRGR